MGQGAGQRTVRCALPQGKPEGPLTVGVTAGASTPNSEVGAAMARILALRGHGVEDAAFPAS